MKPFRVQRLVLAAAVCLLLLQTGLLHSQPQQQELQTRLTELKEKQRSLQTELKREIERLRTYLRYEDQSLGVRVLFGEITAKEAEQSLARRGVELFSSSYTEQDLQTLREQHGRALNTLLDGLARRINAADRWPGDHPAAEYRQQAGQELERIRTGIRQNLVDPKELGPVLESAAALLALTDGRASLPPEENWFAGGDRRVRLALGAAYVAAKQSIATELTRPEKSGASAPVTTTEALRVPVAGDAVGTALMAFSLTDSPKAGLYVAASGGASPRQVAAGTFTVLIWMPDGDIIAFDVSARRMVRVTPDGRVKPLALPFLLECSFSPDGQTVVFEEGSAFGQTVNLYRSSVDGRDKVPLTQDGLSSSGRLSPDGMRIAFFKYMKSGPGADLWLMEADGSNARRVAAGRSPEWSLDGKLLAFIAGEGATSRIQILASDGSGLRTVLPQANLKGVKWSPQGSQLLYTFYAQDQERRETRDQFGIVAADGRGSQVLSEPDEYCTAPVWAPDGQEITYVATRGKNWNTGVTMQTNLQGQRRALTKPQDGRVSAIGWSRPLPAAITSAWLP